MASRTTDLVHDADGPGDPARRRAALEAACDAAREAGEPRGQVAALRALAAHDAGLGDFDSATGLYREAVAACRRTPCGTLLPHTVRHLGDLLHRAGRSAEAEEAYLEALGLYRSDPATTKGDLANAIRAWAVLLESMTRPGEAVEAWGEARELYLEIGVQPGVEEADQALERLSAR